MKKLRNRKDKGLAQESLRHEKVWIQVEINFTLRQYSVYHSLVNSPICKAMFHVEFFFLRGKNYVSFSNRWSLMDIWLSKRW